MSSSRDITFPDGGGIRISFFKKYIKSIFLKYTKILISCVKNDSQFII